jgi:hypothetical protein
MLIFIAFGSTMALLGVAIALLIGLVEGLMEVEKKVDRILEAAEAREEWGKLRSSLSIKSRI